MLKSPTQILGLFCFVTPHKTVKLIHQGKHWHRHQQLVHSGLPLHLCLELLHRKLAHGCLASTFALRPPWNLLLLCPQLSLLAGGTGKGGGGPQEPEGASRTQL